MSTLPIFQAITRCLRTLLPVACDLVRLVVVVSRSRRALAAENLFLRKQLALFQERKVKPRRADDSTRLVMVILSRIFPWRNSLLNVKADTLIRWHRKGFRLFWRWKSKPVGRPRLPQNLRRLIRQMAAENLTWGEERIANELKVKLMIRVSPRTVGKYLRMGGPVRTPDPKQRWLTFVGNHSRVIVACDFFVVVTATFRTLYVFVAMEVASRRILHHNVTAHPTAEWTLQQLREMLPGGHTYRFVIHDRERIYSQEVDQDLANLGVRVLRTPVRAPQANSVCERLGGSLRRECLDFLIPFSERHLQMTVSEWGIHYNRGKPHSSLGPGLPEPIADCISANEHRHKLPDRLPRCETICARRLASRIPSGKGGRMMTRFLIADDTPHTNRRGHSDHHRGPRGNRRRSYPGARPLTLLQVPGAQFYDSFCISYLARVRRLRAKPEKIVVDVYAASPNS